MRARLARRMSRMKRAVRIQVMLRDGPGMDQDPGGDEAADGADVRGDENRDAARAVVHDTERLRYVTWSLVNAPVARS